VNGRLKKAGPSPFVNIKFSSVLTVLNYAQPVEKTFSAGWTFCVIFPLVWTKEMNIQRNGQAGFVPC